MREPEHAAFGETARIKTWYTPADGDNAAWVHFKAVDEEGVTVQEVLGSDLMNLEREAAGAERTAKRVQLVDSLRQMMVEDGWTEIAVDGEWYQYTFVR